MNYVAATGWVRALLLVTLCVLTSLADARAATWQWSGLPARERLTIRLDAPGAEKSLSRSDKQALTLRLGAPPAGLERSGGQDPANAALIDGVTVAGDALVIATRTPGFGYITSRPDPRTVVIDFFADAMGARWTPPAGAQPTPQPTQTSAQQPATTPAATTQAATATQAQPGTVAQQPTPPLATASQPAQSAQAQTTQTPPAQPQQPVELSPRLTQPPSPPAKTTDTQPATPAAQAPPAQSAAQPPTPAVVQPVQPAPQQAQPSAQAPATAQPPVASVTQQAQSGAQSPQASAAQQPSPAVTPPAQPQQTPPATTPPPTEGARGGARGSMVSGQLAPGAPATAPPSATPIAPIPPSPTAATPPAGPQAPVVSGQLAPGAPATAPAQGPATAGNIPAATTATPVASGQGTAATAQAPTTAETPPAPVTTPPEAVQPAAPPKGAAGARPFFSVPHSLRGKVNFGGPEDWPADAALSSRSGAPDNGVAPPPEAPPGQPATAAATTAANGQSQQSTPPGAPQATASSGIVQPVPTAQPGGAPATPQGGASTNAANATGANNATKAAKPAGGNATSANATEPAIIYVDEKGNPVPPPPKPEELLEQAKAHIASQAYKEAMEVLSTLKSLQASPEMQEETLYLISDVLLAMYKNNILEGYEKIVTATNEAMNYNLKSPRVPTALLRLGLVNLRGNNTHEAEGYFKLIKKLYPHDENIPVAYFYLGEDLVKKKQYAQAADLFQYVLQNHPESRYVKECSFFLAKALFSMGQYDQAMTIFDFIDKRWPRLYLELPDYLVMVGDVETRMGRLDPARLTYWTYVNVNPQGAENDMVLARLGDIYTRQKQDKAAREIYEEAQRRYPDKDGGLIAMIRLAEDGIHDDASMKDMFTIFDRPDNQRPAEAYTRVINEYPNSPLVPMARLKLAMWNLFINQHPAAIANAAELAEKHPEHELVPRARAIALQSFTLQSAAAVAEGGYDTIIKTWEQYPMLREQEPQFSPQLRVALGMAFWKSDRPREALDHIAPLLKGNKEPQFGETALSLALSVHLKDEAWRSILDLAQQVSAWDMAPLLRRNLDYAMALSHENLKRPDLALPLWQKLRALPDLPLEQKAYVTFYLSRDAERRRDLQSSYLLNKEALGQFVELAEKMPEKTDNTRIRETISSLMDITEAAGRAQEALDWAGKFAHYVPEGSPDAGALTFRKARLHRKLGNMEDWKKLLDELIRKEPQSVYGKMAASELRTHDVTKGAAKFNPSGQ